MKQWHPPNDKDAFIVKPRLYISHKKAIFGNCIRLLLLVKAERGREKEGEFVCAGAATARFHAEDSLIFAWLKKPLLC